MLTFCVIGMGTAIFFQWLLFREKRPLIFVYYLLFVFDPVRYDNIFCCGLFLENVFSMLIQILVLYAFPLNISYLTYILLDCFIYRLNV